MAVFDDLPHDEQLECLGELAAAALAATDRGRGAAALLNLSENATYKVEPPTAGDYALRVHREGYHSRERHRLGARLAAGACAATASSSRPFRCPASTASLIQAVGHPAMPRPRHVVLFEWEAGREPS